MDRVPLLTGTEGPRRGDRFTVTSEGLLIGRDPTCAVHLEDAGVSREHARVFLHNASVWVQDAGSRNGVYVNDKRVLRPKTVSPGDHIRVGDHSFTIELVEPGEEPGDPPPAPAGRYSDLKTIDESATQELKPVKGQGAPRALVVGAVVVILLAGLGAALALG